MQSILSPDTALLAQQNAQSEASKDVYNKAQAKNAERIRDAAEEFEAVFLSEMLKPMFEGLEVNEKFGGGKGEEIFRGVMLDEYGKEIARKNITGIQTQVMHKMIEMQAERTQAEEVTQPLASISSPIKDAEFTEETVR